MNTSILTEKFGFEVEGNAVEFENLGKLDSDLPALLTYISDEKYLDEAMSKENLKVLIVPKSLELSLDGFSVIQSDDPKHSFYELHRRLFEETDFYGEAFPTIVDQSASIHSSAYVSEENVVIGKNVEIGPNVTILSGTLIGDNVVISPGAVIGSDGFECYLKGQDLISVVHAGRVNIQDNVVIGANCTIDKAIFNEETFIGKSTKFDNLVHIGHGVQVGERVFFPAGITVSGYVTIEDDVWIGVGSTILQRLVIGKGSRISIGSVVTKNVLPDSQVTGNFAVDHQKFIQNLKRSLE